MWKIENVLDKSRRIAVTLKEITCLSVRQLARGSLTPPAPATCPPTASAATRARMIAMTAPEKPITHAELIAKSEARRNHATSRNNRDLSPNLHHHVRAIADTASLSPHAANLFMFDI